MSNGNDRAQYRDVVQYYVNFDHVQTKVAEI